MEQQPIKIALLLSPRFFLATVPKWLVVTRVENDPLIDFALSIVEALRGESENDNKNENVVLLKPMQQQ